jgi:hypothetical protein
VPTSEPPTRDKKQRALDTAKHAAGPGAIIGSIITAVTAIIQANDTSLEQKTYETLAQSNVVMQTEIKTLSERLSTFERALIVSVLNGHPPVAPAAAPPPAAATPEPEAQPAPAPAQPAPWQRPRTVRRAGGGIGSGSAMADVDNLFNVPAEMHAGVVAPPHVVAAQKIADILDRELTIEDGQVEIEHQQTKQPKKAELPSWDKISE